MTNQETIQLARDLKKASRANEAPIWAKLAEYALKPTRARRVINVNRIGELTKEGDMVAFPGKVLGTGNITHGITLFAFSISNTAADKISKAGGSIISHESATEKNPTGRGIVLLG